MSDTVIKADNLSKKYLISHQQKERYTALRDVMVRSMKNFGRKLLSLFTFHGSPFTFYPLRVTSF